MTFQTIKPSSSDSSSTQGSDATSPHTIFSINQLEMAEKRDIYRRMIPPELIAHFQLDESLFDKQGNDLLHLNCPPGGAAAEMALYHQIGFEDPVLYGQINDTVNGQIHVLLYVLNDPDSPRFDVDRTPDGKETKFGTVHRNLEAEQDALKYGLAPGQIRCGLRLLGEAILTFEQFVASLGNELYFVEPLYYHNAIIFERYGFAYEKGLRLMERIQAGFDVGGDLRKLLDGSTPFRQPQAASSIRLRSWALHDGLLGKPFTEVTMYKWIGKSAGINTSGDCSW